MNFIDGSVIHAPLDVIPYDDISYEDRKELEYLQNKLGRPKRSGSSSGDILESLKVAIGQGIKNKIGEIAKGSAVASARLSSSSSHGSSGYRQSGYHHQHNSHPPEIHDNKPLDFWSLKKSVLNTLLQAVKAIKGGVIAVKGQLIKGSGYLTAATGKLIATKGDAVTDLGKKIVASAVLVPHHGHGHTSSGYAEYEQHPESYYSGPSSSEEFYHGAPSVPASDIHELDHHHPYHDDKDQSGLLVLKKIHGDYHPQHDDAAEKLPSIKSIGDTDPGFGIIVAKLLSASSSVDPHKPEPFGYTASGDIHSHNSHFHHHYDVSESKNYGHTVKPSAAGSVVNKEPPPKKEILNEVSKDSTFEKAPTYLSQTFDDYMHSHKKHSHSEKTNSISEVIHKPNKDKNNDVLEPSKPSIPSETFEQHEFNYPPLNVQTLGTTPSPSTNFIKANHDLYNVVSIKDYSNPFPSPIDSSSLITETLTDGLPSNILGQSSPNQNLYYSLNSPSVIDLTQNSHSQPDIDGNVENYISQFSSEVPTYYKHPPSNWNTENLNKHNYLSNMHVLNRPTRLNHYDSSSSSYARYRSKDNRHKQTPLTIYRRPSNSNTRTATIKQKSKPTYDIVNSITYELGMNGPKRLT